jgi:hypothetical protein
MITARALEYQKLKALDLPREPIFDLQHLPRFSKSIRQAAARTSRKGFKVVPFDPSYQKQLEELCTQWQDSRDYHPSNFSFNCVFAIATSLGFTTFVPWNTSRGNFSRTIGKRTTFVSTVVVKSWELLSVCCEL